MNFGLLLILLSSCSLICPAQKSDEKTVNAAQQKILKKQILVGEFDYRAKDVKQQGWLKRKENFNWRLI